MKEEEEPEAPAIVGDAPVPGLMLFLHKEQPSVSSREGGLQMPRDRGTSFKDGFSGSQFRVEEPNGRLCLSVSEFGDDKGSGLSQSACT